MPRGEKDHRCFPFSRSDNCATNTSACSAGYRCSPAFAYECVPCDAGQHCPVSTYIADETNLNAIACTAGFYCPNATVQLKCPAGFYCTQGASTPTSCSLYNLLATSPSTLLPSPATTVLALTVTGASIMSSICLAGSSSIATCDEGFYCPNSSVSIICPEGHYCKQYSTQPRKCGVLTSCPEGTSSPSRSYLSFVIVGVVLLSLIPLFFGLRYVDRKLIREGECKKKQKPVVRKIQKSMKRGGSKSFYIQSPSASNKDPSPSNHYRAFRNISPSPSISFENVSLILEKNVILSKVSGLFEGGQINAVMGPSGSGKTTFLSVISGRVNFACTISGSVQVNEEEADHDVLSKVTGFVPQDDIVHPDLTVTENLSFSAALKLPLSTNNVQLRRLYIEDALGILQLAHVAHKIVGSVESRGVSGGQRKRVSIGLELVASPSILFLDEPTSGLDSTSAMDVLTSLGELAELGMNVIASIHQPRFNTFSLFDKVLFLAPGGKTVYLGSPLMASAWFNVCGFACPNNENPADYLMDAICGKMRHPAARFHPSLLHSWWESHGLNWVAECEHLKSSKESQDSYFKSLGPASQSGLTPTEIADLVSEFDSLAGEVGTIDLTGIENIFHLPKDEAKQLFDEMSHAAGASGTLDRDQFREALLAFGTNWGQGIHSQSTSSAESTLPPAPPLSYDLQPEEEPLMQEEEDAESSGDPRPLHEAIATLQFPSPLRQSRVLLQRSLIKYLRCFWPVKVLDVVVLLFASVIVGLVSKTSWDLDAFPGKTILAMACLGVLGTISFCRTFLTDSLSLRREVESGISITAYFLVANVVDLIWIFVAPAMFWGPVYYLMLPSQGFLYFYLIGVMILWWTSGLAYVCAISLPPSAVFMSSVFATLIFGVFCNGITMKISDNRGKGEFLLSLSYNRWAFEVLTLMEFANYPSQRTMSVMGFQNLGVCGLDLVSSSDILSYLLSFNITEDCKKYINQAFGALVALGLGLRLAAWIILKFKTMRTYPKILLATVRVAMRSVSRLSTRAISAFSNHPLAIGQDEAKAGADDNKDLMGQTSRGPSRLFGGSNKVAPLDESSAKEPEAAAPSSTRIKSGYTEV